LTPRGESPFIDRVLASRAWPDHDPGPYLQDFSLVFEQSPVLEAGGGGAVLMPANLLDMFGR